MKHDQRYAIIMFEDNQRVANAVWQHFGNSAVDIPSGWLIDATNSSVAVNSATDVAQLVGIFEPNTLTPAANGLVLSYSSSDGTAPPKVLDWMHNHPLVTNASG